MKKISFVIPVFNELNNIREYLDLISSFIAQRLKHYGHEIIFIDNCSNDGTRECIREICSSRKDVRAIFCAGKVNNDSISIYGLCQTDGNCATLLHIGDPIEIVDDFVREWECGYKIVCGINESKRLPFYNRCYQWIMKGVMREEYILRGFSGFGLYDNSFIDVLRNLVDATPYFKGIVAELGFKRKDIVYRNDFDASSYKRKNIIQNYNDIMQAVTSLNSKTAIRIVTYIGFILSFFSVLAAVAYVILKFLMWDDFPAGMMPAFIVVTVLGSVQMLFLGLLSEYILNINNRIIHRPLVIEEERINM